MMKLKITEIELDSGLQARAMMSQPVIDEYTEVIRNGGVMPPITLFHDGSKYYLADGWHRLFGHKSAGFAEIDVDIKKGTRRDAILYSVSANDKHGLRRSNLDKRKAVLVLLEDFEWSEWTDVKIAEQCGVSSMFVGKQRKEMNGGAQIERKVVRGDTEYKINTGKMGRPTIESDVPVEDDGYYEEDKLEEMATEFKAIAEENEELKAKLAVGLMEGTDEDKKKASQIIEEQQALIKSLEAQVKGLTASRDSYQIKNSELIKQVNYWKKQAQK
jgi:hypothetical protein